MPLIVRYERSLLAKQAGFAYQVSAVEAIKNLEYAAVFHEQGLGKTKIAIDLALYWLSNSIVDSVLIVTKKGLLQNWREELAQHSYLQPRMLSQDRKANYYAFNSPSRMYLLHYEVIQSEQKRIQLFLRTRRVAVILDEAHRIKNPNAAITKSLFAVAPGFVRRVVLTGTPVANRPYDLWAPIAFLDGGKALGKHFSDFRSSLDLRNDFHQREDKALAFERTLAGVYDRLRPFTVRETKDTAGIALPTKEIKNVLVELAERQAELYREFQEELSAVVIRAGRLLRDDAEEMLKRLLRLVQVASNPALVDQAYSGTPCKLPVLDQLVGKAADDSEKVIVWTSFTDNVNWLARELRPFNPVRVHGKLPIATRDAAIARFKADAACKVLIATPASAKEGFTLTIANHAIFYDRSFSLDDYIQAQDRIHRISQVRRCYITNLVAAGTIDEWVDVLLGAKQLAAQLGQGDISYEMYTKRVTYVYGAMLRDILGLAEEELDDGNATH
jgi:SNF2 family DNA or RNA helicase